MALDDEVPDSVHGQMSSQGLSPVPPISTELDESVQHTLSSRGGHVLPEGLPYRPTRQRLLDCYQYPGRLNNENINAYLNLLSENANGSRTRTRAFNSLLFSKLQTEGPETARSWAFVHGIRDADLFQLDTIRRSVHVNGHWC